MSYGRIERAVETLQNFLRLLPKNSKFNVISFGSDFDYLYSTSQPSSYIEDAIQKVSKFDANYGGTEILKPIKDIIKTPITLPRYVFLITDGDVSNSD